MRMPQKYQMSLRKTISTIQHGWCMIQTNRNCAAYKRISTIPESPAEKRRGFCVRSDLRLIFYGNGERAEGRPQAMRQQNCPPSARKAQLLTAISNFFMVNILQNANFISKSITFSLTLTARNGSIKADEREGKRMKRIKKTISLPATKPRRLR